LTAVAVIDISLLQSEGFIINNTSYIIIIAIIVGVLIACVFVGKIFVVIIAKKLAVALAKKAVKKATLYAKDQIQTLTETKEETSKHDP
jgi:hypothetical protein